jgi:hypothetical protein
MALTRLAVAQNLAQGLDLSAQTALFDKGFIVGTDLPPSSFLILDDNAPSAIGLIQLDQRFAGEHHAA